TDGRAPTHSGQASSRAPQPSTTVHYAHEVGGHFGIRLHCGRVPREDHHLPADKPAQHPRRSGRGRTPPPVASHDGAGGFSLVPVTRADTHGWRYATIARRGQTAGVARSKGRI